MGLTLTGYVVLTNFLLPPRQLTFSQEYPGAADRGGNDDDGVNYTKLLSDLRSVFSGVISFTAPTSYWVGHLKLFCSRVLEMAMLSSSFVNKRRS